jgi:hypothetical protein
VRRPAGGRSGIRRRSRLRSTTAPDSAAHLVTAARLAGASVTPSGNWCAAVTTTAGLSSSDTRRPSSSTGTPTTRAPEARAIGGKPGKDGSSNAISPAPRSRSTLASKDRACAYPPQTTIRSGSASTPRLRPRYFARARTQSWRAAVRPVAEHIRRHVLQRPAGRGKPCLTPESG